MIIQSEKMQVIFVETTECGEFRDALYIPVDEYDSMTDEQYSDYVNKSTSERIETFVDRVKNPPIIEEVEPTEEDIQNELDSIEQQKIYLENRKTELTSTMSAMISAKMNPVDEKPIEDIKNVDNLDEKVL
jgi:hypothetical protein